MPREAEITFFYHATRKHKTTEMGEVFAALGLAQNFAAMRALATEGIQRGHMELHSRNVAIQAGATGDMVDKMARIMIREKKVRADRAKELLDEMML